MDVPGKQHTYCLTWELEGYPIETICKTVRVSFLAGLQVKVADKNSGVGIAAAYIMLQWLQDAESLTGSEACACVPGTCKYEKETFRDNCPRCEVDDPKACHRGVPRGQTSSKDMYCVLHDENTPTCPLGSLLYSWAQQNSRRTTARGVWNFEHVMLPHLYDDEATDMRVCVRKEGHTFENTYEETDAHGQIWHCLEEPTTVTHGRKAEVTVGDTSTLTIRGRVVAASFSFDDEYVAEAPPNDFVVSVSSPYRPQSNAAERICQDEGLTVATVSAVERINPSEEAGNLGNRHWARQENGNMITMSNDGSSLSPDWDLSTVYTAADYVYCGPLTGNPQQFTESPTERPTAFPTDPVDQRDCTMHPARHPTFLRKNT